MSTFQEIYQGVEKTFWNSLTKKLMSFLLLFFIDVGYLAIYFHQKGLIAEELSKSGASVVPQTSRFSSSCATEVTPA